MLALVRDHQRMHQARGIIFTCRPKTANPRLSFEDGYLEATRGCIVKKRLGSHKAGWARP